LGDFFEDCFLDAEEEVAAKLVPEETVAAKTFPEDIAEVEETPAGGVACARSPGTGKRGPSSATGILAISALMA
jgi:hypothetical protein